ncbi:50S ribosomal protein L3 N(5)-glutamine methyltransferase [Polynucleobacter paneuropaeus]|jgi:ribosomal protein L3 glutamine methyltransferase|uniref:50S ribosomal protein L3 N(5)-glutamine methyltransferase n=1 Tax=Polynucleobacter paneuropaeus TaxID=2527775 RepID=A0A9Q2ZW73_9BURK|nr:50S ribosomal protein L3 N(5)-glutamine methyltransferase [Polynucleobacter paneuropaeus]MBT8514011.1 50S ribosomal protein L3 N(5)-glutamine methyltransferase [Polynucleobacter paneuropaeus]MBT8518597.1 50S ribosomal protein L3 N(5)-glutamine methyltransferase [Polynucleobacter paneuropaeus]MBT8531124.1 50S ribosomal protein L3 N(5)-glutamine methyltransferase [Polynucleobacter paneuropaeus]MBT8550503.1 50S ribosomal protein L3 N(5)-glutamine methyltransferase [Polynucleobacter paneuropaeus
MDPEPQPQLTVDQSIEQVALLLEKAKLHYGHGASDAPSEALWIVSKQLDLSPSDALDQLQQVISPENHSKALALAQLRIDSQKPLAYLLGEAWLMGVPFYSNEQSIVPRSWIAELIVNGDLEPWLPADGKALDLCTGNGSLAILLALACPDIQVSACDISLPALALASRNLDRHGLSEQIDLLNGDLWEALSEPNEENRFDLIICNPPYVNADSMSKLPAEYLAEPSLALAGGEDGMDLIRKIIRGAPDYLSERGALLLEIGNEYENFKKAFPQIPAIWMEVSAGDQQVLLIQAEDLH